jgi:hypothetical protein
MVIIGYGVHLTPINIMIVHAVCSHNSEGGSSCFNGLLRGCIVFARLLHEGTTPYRMRTKHWYHYQTMKVQGMILDVNDALV